MAFDGIVIKQIIKELNTCLLNGKINKVYEPNKNEILFGIYNNGKNYLLNININPVNYRIHLTNSTKPNPNNAFNFCMLLRKHLIGMHIKSINNYDLERIITIELEGFNELNDITTKKLIIELMGKHSNVILLNKDDIIIDSLRHLDTYTHSNRDILPAHKYILPSNNKISFINLKSFDEFYNIIENSEFQNVVDTISNTFIGLSKVFLQYLFEKLSLNLNSINKNDLEMLYNYIKNIIISSSLSCVNYSYNNKNDYTIDLSNETSSLEVNSFIDNFYSLKESQDNFKNYRNNILKLILLELKKYTKRLSNINQKLEECNKMDTYKLYGELITANLYKINNNVNTDKILLENYYDNNNIIEIPLDKTISISYNAKKYFKKYNKLKNALQIVNFQKADTSIQIDYIESIIYELDNAKTIEDINSIYEEISENILFKNAISNKKANIKKNTTKKKKNEENFSPLIYTIDNYTVFVGKNNKQNDYLTLKFAHKNDLWFHTKDVHGSHVILRTNGDEIEQTLINKCANIAAFYSKASSSSNVSVDYTYVRYVKKPSSSKPGMVIYTNYSTVNVLPKNPENLCDKKEN